MAVPRDRSPVAEFTQGSIDNSYIQLAPNRGGLVELSWPIQRALYSAWPQYVNVEVHGEDPFALSRRRRAAASVGQPIEPWSRYVPRRDRVQVFRPPALPAPRSAY